VTISSLGIKSSPKSQQAYLNPQHLADAGLIPALGETGPLAKALAFGKIRGGGVAREGGSAIQGTTSERSEKQLDGKYNLKKTLIK